jgi:acylphosphatase
METAIKLKLNGFVRNLPDGTVYIEAQGAEEPLKSLIAWCHKGPPLSRVEEVRTEFSDIPERYKGFTIVR